MIKIILAVFFLVLIAFNIQTSYGYEVTFQEWGTRIQDTPTVCIIEPSNENAKYLTEKLSERMMKQSHVAIEEWEVLLKESERTKDKSMWEIEIIDVAIESQKEFDYKVCNVILHFEDKPELEEEWYKVLGKTTYEEGNTGRSQITAYYEDIDFCKTEDAKFVYYDPCYSDSPRLMVQLTSIVKHEFGHALGLGHYVADNLDVSVQWARGIVNAPSIMAVFTHQNENENRITPKDTAMIRTLYGENGFSHNKIVEKEIFQLFGTSSEEYVIPDNGFQIAIVEGLINSEEIVDGVPLVLEITAPDGTSALENIRINSNGIFNMQKIIDSTLSNGTYSVIATYRGETSDKVSFDVLSEGIVNESSKIPTWIKNSTIWGSEDKIEDDSFVLVVEYFFKKNILKPLSSHVDEVITKEAGKILDTDGDGIPDKADDCPLVAETFDGFEDSDGCPETNSSELIRDSDQDGISDVNDVCPLERETYNKFKDEDGCPDNNDEPIKEDAFPDTDGDGIEDRRDQCNFQPENYNGYLDEDGCPDDDESIKEDAFPDTDGDGIEDRRDQCNFQPENYNGYLDEDGCPDSNDVSIKEYALPDTDGDGIPDKSDSCKNEPEIFNNILDGDGCPETEDVSTGAVIDTDNDGIPDNIDQCPNDKEVYNKIQDSDGCPETNSSELTRDSDFDGIEDKEDDCPLVAEDFDGFEDSDGCPDIIFKDKRVIPKWIKQNVKWWVNDEITDEDFISGIQYLIKTGSLVI